MGTTIARLTTHSSWTEFAEVLWESKDFKTRGGLRGESGHPLWYSAGRLEGRWREAFAAGRELQEITYVVYSYSTPIAWQVAGAWMIPPVAYSLTTSKHQTKILTALHDQPQWPRESE